MSELRSRHGVEILPWPPEILVEIRRAQNNQQLADASAREIARIKVELLKSG